MKRSHMGKRDQNEPEIVLALRTAGCEVTCGKDVDLWVHRPATGLSKMMEIKVEGKEMELTALQVKLARIFQGVYVVVSTPERALAEMGIT